MKIFLLSVLTLTVASCCDEFEAKSCQFTQELNKTPEGKQQLLACVCNNKPYPTFPCNTETWKCSDDRCNHHGLEEDGLFYKPTQTCLREDLVKSP